MLNYYIKCTFFLTTTHYQFKNLKKSEITVIFTLEGCDYRTQAGTNTLGFTSSFNDT